MLKELVFTGIFGLSILLGIDRGSFGYIKPKNVIFYETKGIFLKKTELTLSDGSKKEIDHIRPLYFNC